MKKRIFISMHYMEIGGAEISLVGLLRAIDYLRYDVDLFIYSHQGALMNFIPKEVNVIPELPQYAQIEHSLLNNIKQGYWSIASAKLFAKCKHQFYRRKMLPKKEDYSYPQFLAKEIIPHLPSLFYLGNYDLAISFMHPHNIVQKKVNSNKKICWIHTDYSAVDIIPDQELPVWSAFDHVVSISPDVTNTFLQKFPSLKDKIVVIENILSPEFVRQRAEVISDEEVEKEMPREKDIINLLSVGRFCEAKNYDNVPDTCLRINSSLFTFHSSLKVRWFIIGYGGDEQLIRQKIQEAGVEDQVIILGKKLNPYPYIKACDIYVQPSRYEGKSVTVREAQMLCKPVVVTDYPTASSQIKNGIDGVIVPMDNEGCAHGILSLINDEAKQQAIINYLHTHDYGNELEVEKLYALLK